MSRQCFQWNVAHYHEYALKAAAGTLTVTEDHRVAGDN